MNAVTATHTTTLQSSIRGFFVFLLLCTWLPFAGNAQCPATAAAACGTSNAFTLANGTGAWNIGACGYTTPGTERVYSYTVPTTGNYTITVSSMTGAYGDFVDAFYKIGGGCNNTGWLCIDDFSSFGVPFTSAGIALTAGQTLFLLFDREQTTGGNCNLAFTINCPPPPAPNPCPPTATITCGTNTTTTIPAGSGFFNNSLCFWGDPGGERIFQYTPVIGGPHNITISGMVGSSVNLAYKEASTGCNATGWTCIANVWGNSTYGPVILTAGVTYYFLFDNTSTATATNLTFNVSCAPIPGPGANCALAIPIGSIPYTNTATTCGAINDYISSAALCDNLYLGGEDYVYSLNVTTAPVTYNFTVTNNDFSNFIGVHVVNACLPGGTCLGSGGSGFFSNTATTGAITINTNGTYFVIIDTYPFPNCANFTLNINVALPPPPQFFVNPPTSYTNLQIADAITHSSCATSNAVGTGNTAQRSTYINGGFLQTGPGISFATGVILSTGDAINANGPNDFTNLGTNYFGPGNANLASVLPGPPVLYDAYSLEFDIVPSGNRITLTYAFGSEEYTEFVGTGYIDAVGMFINSGSPNLGTSCSPVLNAALVPGTALPVQINNINPGSFPALYRDNPSLGLASNHPIEYDGLTVPLQAVAVVTPGNVHHVQFVVADVQDGNFDSGFMIPDGGCNCQTTLTPGNVTVNPCVLNAAWLSLNAVVLQDRTQLTWVPASSRTAAQFWVERSLDGEAFIPVGTVAGSEQQNGEYRFTDPQVFPGAW